MAQISIDYGSVNAMKILSNQIFTKSSPLTFTCDFEPNFVIAIYTKIENSTKVVIYKDTFNNKKGYLIAGTTMPDSEAEKSIIISGNTVTITPYDDNYNSPNSDGAMIYAFNIF